ncbi:succinate dehydrogenase [Yoonia sp. GPGPB17]|uniref:succinate dehydrogenase n=1 Tax=Yoonia sp. GPGPB17 TaxID=3026147 RepID=UPI0030C01B71
MRLMAALGAASMMLAGCMQDLGPAGDVLARDAAKGVVNTAVQARFPGVDARPLTDCIIDNASSAEIIQIAEGAIVGANAATTDLIVRIAERPDTIRCTVNNSLGLNGLTL